MDHISSPDTYLLDAVTAVPVPFSTIRPAADGEEQMHDRARAFLRASKTPLTLQAQRSEPS